MKNKFFIIIICLVALTIVLGTRGSISFSRIEGSFELVSISSNQLVDDFSFAGLVLSTTKYFFEDPDEIVIMNGYEEGIGYYSELQVTFYGSEWYETEHITETFYFSSVRSQDFAKSFVDPLITVSQVEYDGAFVAVINAIQYLTYIIEVLFLVVSLVFVVLFDTILIVLSLATCFLRIIGLLA